MLSYLGKTGSINLNILEVIGITFILYGILSVYASLSNGYRDRLFLSSVLFFVGIVFIVEFNFNLVDLRGLTFASILLIGGGAFLILFIDNSKEKIFLIAAVVLIALGFISTNILKQLGIFKTVNKLADWVDVFWPVIFIFLGIIIFLTRKK